MSRHCPTKFSGKSSASASASLAVLFFTSAMAVATPGSAEEVSVVDRPATTARNDHYVGNRKPLLPSRWIKLPVGAVRPAGWLLVYLEKQRDGLTGQLGKISAWLQKEDNAWLSKDGKGKYGWEELPYWLKGYGDMAYLLDDQEMIAETKIWIEGALNSQRPNGDFGPDQRFEDGSRDYWANMLMLFCLQSYYEHSHDHRVIDLMTRYFHYQLTVPDDKFLTGYWQRMRGGDNLSSVYWLYNRTGDEKLLELAKKLHRNTADWTQRGTLPNWHNVNVAEAFGEPGAFFLQSHNPNDLKAAYNNFREIRQRFGQVPGGMFGGDENSRVGYDDPRQAVETCGMVEQMLSDETLLRITGDPFWADNCETVAFNTYPAAVMPDFRSLRYLTAPNMVVSDDKNHHPGIDNSGPFLMMNPFSSRCCQHNHSHGWPYFCENLWLASPDNGVCAAMYMASTAHIEVGDEGTDVAWTTETHYPFEEQVRMTLAAPKPVEFPLYLRIPAWCRDASIKINGEKVDVDAEADKYVRLERTWKDGDAVTLDLPMHVRVRRWKHNHNSASIDYGPLTFSLKIGEEYVRRDSAETAIGDSHWQEGADSSLWPSYEIHPTTPWNYGLVLPENPEESLEVVRKPWPQDDFPFTLDSVPLEIHVKGKRIPQWKLDENGLCAVLQDSPVASDEPTEQLTLVPMGAARLRISAFPVIGNGPDAHHWTEPKIPPVTASHVHDQLSAVIDGKDPKSSADHSIPRFTWWDHRGGSEWIAREFPQPCKVSEVEVYWFDDTGIGACRTPKSWSLSYKSGDKWLPVEANGDYGTKVDQFNRVKFTPIETTALRIDVQLRKGVSGGVLEWRVDK